MHAAWNLVLKTSRRKLAFNVFMHGSAISIFSAWWVAAQGAIPLPRGPVLLFALGGGLFFSLYHMCLTAAYERIDVSLAYPLTTTGPLYIPLWAYLFLGARTPCRTRPFRLLPHVPNRAPDGEGLVRHLRTPGQRHHRRTGGYPPVPRAVRADTHIRRGAHRAGRDLHQAGIKKCCRNRPGSWPLPGIPQQPTLSRILLRKIGEIRR